MDRDRGFMSVMLIVGGRSQVVKSLPAAADKHRGNRGTAAVGFVVEMYFPDFFHNIQCCNMVTTTF